jgi:hypothetical protein
MIYMKKSIIAIFIFYFLLMPVLPVFAGTFDPSFIISDAEINDYKSMTQEQVINFLKEKNSFLVDYACEDIDGKIRRASEIIYTLSQENKINPKFMLVLLQKEQSLVEDSSPSTYQLNAATGYGCFDGQACNSRWNGFFRQVNSAFLQFRSYLDEAELYRYKTDNTYVFNNSVKTIKTIDIVTPKNQATAALYNYTPHVYYGNYNVWKLWNKYFPAKKTYYPDGSLLSAIGEDGVYLIQNGEKRPFLSKAALLSRFSLDKIINIEGSDLESYIEGMPIRFPNYSILKSPQGDLYLLVGDVKREIPSMAIFNAIGFNEDEIIKATIEELQDYILGKPLSETDSYPTGALLQDKSSGGVYFVLSGIKYPIWSKSIMEINYPNKKIIPVSREELDGYTNGSPVKLREGELVKSPHEPIVYVISNSKKRPITNEKTFLTLGYKWSDIKDVNNKTLELHETGDSVDTTIDQDSVVVALTK